MVVHFPILPTVNRKIQGILTSSYLPAMIRYIPIKDKTGLFPVERQRAEYPPIFYCFALVRQKFVRDLWIDR